MGALLELNLPVSRMLRIAVCSIGLERSERGTAFDGYAVGMLDIPESVRYSCLADGDGLAVAAAIGVFGERLAVALDFADVGFAVIGVGCDGEHDGVGRGGIEDEGDGLGFGVAAG